MLLTFANLVTAALLILLAVWRTRKLLAQRQAFQLALNAERERAQITLASIGQAVISTGADGRLDYMNAVAEKLLACPFGTARGKPIAWLFRLVDKDTSVEIPDWLSVCWPASRVVPAPVRNCCSGRTALLLPSR